MKYRFKIKASGAGAIYAQSLNVAEHVASSMAEEFIYGCKVETEYPDNFDADYTVDFIEGPTKVTAENGDTFKMSKYSVLLTYTFDWDFEATQMSVLVDHDGTINDELEEMAQALFVGSKFAQKEIKIDYTFSGEQPGLEDLMMWVDNDLPFCIQSDGCLYHIPCAYIMLNSEEVDAAIEHGDDANGVSCTRGLEFTQAYEGAFFQLEENHATCECGNSLFDEPVPVAERE
jgi:hypothetical protein